MADDTSTPAPLSDAERQQFNELAARDAAVIAATKAAGDKAMSDLVNTDAFKAARSVMETALAAKPLEVDLSYAIGCMDRLTNRYAA